MIFKSITIAYVALVFLFSISNCDSLSESSGFTTDLIHRDSPQSSSYDPSLSPSQRLVNSIRRSLNRVHRFNADCFSKPKLAQTDIINSGGEYLMKYSIGSPPVPSLGLADTGSDLIWTQCQPCRKCFKQTFAIFDPRRSSSYKTIPCNSPGCKSLQATSCNRTCQFSETYGDGSFTQGDLSTDTFTLPSSGGQKVSIPNTIFGCGFKNGLIIGAGESGIVGLGGGKASLVHQLGPIAQGKFSYCLVSLSSNSKSSKLNFGANAVVSGRGVVSTPLAKKNPDTFYYLTLEGISIGNQRLQSGSRQDGNIVIDSGTTLTVLPTDLYNNMVKTLQSSIKLKRVEDPQGVLDLCYSTRNDIQIPRITVHFKGADVWLKPDNVFVRLSDDLVCFAARPTPDIGIYGNLWQVNFLVGYDLQKRTVSFKATNCGK